MTNSDTYSGSGLRQFFCQPKRRVSAPTKSLLTCVFIWVSQPALADDHIASLCESAAQIASLRTGVPLDVLRAISLTETGRKSGKSFRPWPWTVNMEGKGVWFDTKAEAQAYASRNFDRGARSFDVGCFQLNYKWHGQAFASVEAMFDPVENALYAAKFLTELYQEMGNWTEAAGAYHSRTPKFANRYKKRFRALYARLSNQPLPDSTMLAAETPATIPESEPATLVVRLNTFPLLQGGSAARASLGSLMPASAGIGAKSMFGGG